jgi:hypothetical protein
VDFVVVGFGLGAVGVLLGVVILGWLAPRSQRAAARVSAVDDAARCRALAAEHRGTGQAFLYAGGAMLLATAAGLLGSLDDRTGAFLVTTTATVAAVGILLAGYLQRARNPMPPRRRARSAPPSSVTAPSPTDTRIFLADPSPQVQNLAESVVESPHAEMPPTSDFDPEAFVADETAPVPPAASAAFSSGANDPAPLGDSPVVADVTDARSWQPGDHTESSPSRPDEEDPSSGHS